MKTNFLAIGILALISLAFLAIPVSAQMESANVIVGATILPSLSITATSLPALQDWHLQKNAGTLPQNSIVDAITIVTTSDTPGTLSASMTNGGKLLSGTNSMSASLFLGQADFNPATGFYLTGVGQTLGGIPLGSSETRYTVAQLTSPIEAPGNYQGEISFFASI